MTETGTKMAAKKSIRNQERTVVSPYVGMARKQVGGSNGCIYRLYDETFGVYAI